MHVVCTDDAIIGRYRPSADGPHHTQQYTDLTHGNTLAEVARYVQTQLQTTQLTTLHALHHTKYTRRARERR